MSEGGGEGQYGGGGGGGNFPPSQPATPSSTVPDPQAAADKSVASGLPPFSSFSAADIAEGLGSRLTGDHFGSEGLGGRLLDISGWDYYGEGLTGRLLDRGDGFPMIIPQAQYRPWESKPQDSNSQDSVKTMEYPTSPVANKLPSFQSQFNAFPQESNGETVTLTTLTPAPPSPSNSSSGLPSFHTLSTVNVNPRGYPLVPAPVQAREIPSIQQQFLDERHIHLFQGPPGQYHQIGLQGNTYVTAPQSAQQTTLLTVVKSEPVIVTAVPPHQAIYQTSHLEDHDRNSPGGLLDSRKKERRKVRASSLESSTESDGVGSSSVESSGQVAAISSTAGFKSPMISGNPMGGMMGQQMDLEDCGDSDKPVKKKRKRCGECIGCQRKDNCGDCAPCRNDKSHQICKMRRCEKLTEKKHLLYLNHDYPRGERGRGRGKSRGASTPTPQPVRDIKLESPAVAGNPTLTPTMPGSVMPFYGSVQSGNMVDPAGFAPPIREHRMLPNAVWHQTPAPPDPNTPIAATPGGWTPQGQFIQQLPTHQHENLHYYHPQYSVATYHQPAPAPAATPGGWTPQGQFIQQLPTHQLEDLRYHHPQYSVATYHQPAPAPGYQQTQQTAFVQTNGNYTPVVNGNLTAIRNGPMNGVDYLDASPRSVEYINGAYTHTTEVPMAPPPSTTPNSRCSSVQLDNSENTNCKTPTPTTPSNGAGNAMPGYPPQQPPQQQQQSSHNSSGYPGQDLNSADRRGEVKNNNMNQIWSKSDTPKDFDNQSWRNEEQVKSEEHISWNENRNQSHANAWRENEMSIKQEEKEDTSHEATSAYQQEKAQINNKLKTMILNKQQQNQALHGLQASEQQQHVNYQQNVHVTQSNSSLENNQQAQMQSQQQHQLLLQHRNQLFQQQQSKHQQMQAQSQSTRQNQMPSPAQSPNSQKQNSHNYHQTLQQIQSQHSYQSQVQQNHNHHHQQLLHQQQQQQELEQKHQHLQQQQQQQNQQQHQQQQNQHQQQQNQHQQQQNQHQQQQNQHQQQQQQQNQQHHLQQQQQQQQHQQQLQHQQQQQQIQQQQQLQQQHHHQQQIINHIHTQQMQQNQHQQVIHVKPQTPSPVHHQQQQSPAQHLQTNQQSQFAHQQQQIIQQQNIHQFQQIQQQHIQQQQFQQQQQYLQQSQHQMSPQRSQQSTPDISPRSNQRRSSTENLMMSPSQDSQCGVRYRTPTPNSTIGEVKTSSQGSQTSYKHDIQTSTAQSHFGMETKPTMQQTHFEKSNSNSQNFLAQGHHPRSLATEGGGTWDLGSPKKEPENESSAMENFMKFAASLTSASEHLSKKGSSNRQHFNLKSSWHLPNGLSLKQESSEIPIDDKPFPKTLIGFKEESKSWGQKALEQKPARDSQGRFTWAKTNKMETVKTEPDIYSWQEHTGIDVNHPAYRENFGVTCQPRYPVEQPPPMRVKPNHLRVPFGTDPRLNEPVEKIDEKNGQVKQEAARFVFDGAGGPQGAGAAEGVGAWCCRKGGTAAPSLDHVKVGCCHLRTKDELLEESDEATLKQEPSSDISTPIKQEPCDNNENLSSKYHLDYLEGLKNNIRPEVPDCNCFPPEHGPPEPGSYYTHLGAAASLPDLRCDLEQRTGFQGIAIRVEKILYTGKEGKTTSGCPLAKWVIRRASLDEKLLVVVKHRPGHHCSTAWIVVVIVAWEGVISGEADNLYSMLTHKLNKYGLPTLRRCATNEPRTCACQGLDQDTCGASYSFGCSWSMYYNGCKYARSKTVRKFRLSVQNEEEEVEERLQGLANHLSPIYRSMAPASWTNQTQFEEEAGECRLGTVPGRPFGGVTACIDFCAHSHRDLHNMNSGCTVVVTLTKHRSLSKPEDEQLHVLPLYVMDETDEFGNQQAQVDKISNGAIEVLSKFPCEVRVRTVPLKPCRKHGKKRKDEEEGEQVKRGRPRKVKGARRHSTGSIHKPTSETECLQPNERVTALEDEGYHTSNPLHRLHSPNSYLGHQSPSPHNSELTPNHRSQAHISKLHQTSNLQSREQSPNPQSIAHSPNHHPQDQILNLHQTPNVQSRKQSPVPQSHAHSPNHYPPGHILNLHQTPNLLSREQLRSQTSSFPRTSTPLTHQEMVSMLNTVDAQLQSAQVSSTVLDSPNGSFYQSWHTPGQNWQLNRKADDWSQLAVEKIDADSTTHYNMTTDPRNSPSSVASRTPISLQDKWPRTSVSPSSPMYRSSAGRSEQTDSSTRGSSEEFSASPTHPQLRIPTSRLNSPMHMSPTAKATPPQLSPSNSQEWPYQEPWDSNSPSVSPQASPFRVPRGRPPSRNHFMSTPQSPTLEPSTFLKPFPPNNRDNQINTESQTTSNRLSDSLKLEFDQTVKTESDWHSWNPDKQIAWNEKCAQKNNPPTSSNNLLKSEWPNEFITENSNLAYMPHHPTESFKKIPVIKQETSMSWLKTEESQTIDKDFMLPKSEKAWTGQNYASDPIISLERENSKLSSPSFPSYGCQGMSQFQLPRWDLYGPTPYVPMTQDQALLPPLPKPLGEVTEYIQNEECFRDSQMGGVAIALGHGSVLFECAKHELHATTALKKPDRRQPTRISLVFYQHRNLNHAKHGGKQWEDKCRRRKLGVIATDLPVNTSEGFTKTRGSVWLRSSTLTTTTWTTLFPMYPCIVSGPYQESGRPT